MSNPNKKNNKVFVGGFPVHLNDDKLREYMNRFGSVLSCKILKKNGRSRGFGFVTFASAHSAKKVINKEHMCEGKKFDCKYVVPGNTAKSQAKRQKQRKVFVGGISKEVTEENLRLYFSRYGCVERAVVNRKHYTDVSRGSGYILFRSKKAAKQVLAEKKPHSLLGKTFTCHPCLLHEEIKKMSKAKDNRYNRTKNGSLQSLPNEERAGSHFQRDSFNNTIDVRTQPPKMSSSQRTMKKPKRNSVTNSHNEVSSYVEEVSTIRCPKNFPYSNTPTYGYHQEFNQNHQITSNQFDRSQQMWNNNQYERNPNIFKNFNRYSSNICPYWSCNCFQRINCNQRLCCPDYSSLRPNEFERNTQANSTHYNIQPYSVWNNSYYPSRIQAEGYSQYPGRNNCMSMEMLSHGNFIGYHQSH